MLWAAALAALVAPPARAADETLCGGAVVPLTLTRLASPYVRARLGGEDGYFQIDTGSTTSTVDAEVFHRPVGASLVLDDFTFPTFRRARFTTLNLGLTPGPIDRRQIGQIGTDLLRHRVVELHYETTPPYLAIADQPCSAKALADAGFVPIAQRGYFGSDRSRLGNVVDNTPVVFLRLGKASLPAWIDSGLVEEPTSGIVQVNDAALRLLRAAGVTLAPERGSRITNCHGETLRASRWRVAGATMEVETDAGRPLFTYDAPLVEVMPRNSCSGPGNIKVPVARLGAAYLALWGTLVLDGLGERVWLAPVRAQAPAAPRPRRAIVAAQGADGSVSVGAAETVERAKAEALASCGERGSACAVTLVIAPSEQRCVALARSRASPAKLVLTARPALEAAKRAALDQCVRGGRGACTIEFARCNS